MIDAEMVMRMRMMMLEMMILMISNALFIYLSTCFYLPTVGAIQHYKTIGSIEHRPALELKPIHPSWELAKVTYFFIGAVCMIDKA